MKIRFKTRRVYGENIIIPFDERSEALFMVIKRSHINIPDLYWLGKVGFEVEIVGEVKDLSIEMKKKGVNFKKQEGAIFYEDGE